jgi:hypothetical protein
MGADGIIGHIADQKIANLLGYSYVRNISRWFQKAKK